MCRRELEDHKFQAIDRMLLKREDYCEIRQKYAKFMKELWIFQTYKYDRESIRNESNQNLAILLGEVFYGAPHTKFFQTIVLEISGRALGINKDPGNT
jgi:hypothetical protein